MKHVIFHMLQILIYINVFRNVIFTKFTVMSVCKNNKSTEIYAYGRR